MSNNDFEQSPQVAGGWEPEAAQPYIMRRGEKGAGVFHGLTSYFGTDVEWALRDRPDEVRTPTEQTRIFRKDEPFQAAGQTYRDLDELLTMRRDHPAYAWYKDCYGRKVVYMERLFPCFDSYDFEHEDRYYRWFFLCEDGKLTRIYTEDEEPEIYVTEDVSCLEDECWTKLESLGYLEQR